MDIIKYLGTSESIISLTDSIKTSQSSDKNEVLDKIDLNELDLHIKIQTERITAIINEVIYKTEIVIFLLQANHEDLTALKECVKEEDFKEIENFIKDFRTKKFDSPAKYKMITKFMMQIHSKSSGSKIYPELSKVIWVMTTYKNIQALVIEKIEKLRLEHKQEVDDASELIAYHHTLLKLKDKIVERLNNSAAEKLKKELLLRNLMRTNKALGIRITDAADKLKQEREAFKVLFKTKEELVIRHQEELDLLTRECKSAIAKKILEIESEMEEASNEHKVKCDFLDSKIEESVEEYESLIKRHMEVEDDLRTKRIQVEEELRGWLQKYDDVVGEKQTYLDEITKCYEDEKAELENLQMEFEEQEKMYIPLMAEKEEDYRREVLSKVKVFIEEHAARVLQRAWRRVLSARAEKKRLKRLAGKKKKGKTSKNKKKVRKSNKKK